MSETPIEKAIRLAGGPAELGKIVERSKRQVFNVKGKQGGFVPVDWCPKISTQLGIPLHELNPAFAAP